MWLKLVEMNLDLLGRDLVEMKCEMNLVEVNLADMNPKSIEVG